MDTWLPGRRLMTFFFTSFFFLNELFFRPDFFGLVEVGFWGVLFGEKLWFDL